MPRFPLPFRLRWAVLGAAILVAAGCQRGPDEITTYDAPRDPPRGIRLLGAIVSRPDATWFFKLTGPNAFVSEVVPSFDALIKSVKFPGKPEIDFQLPRGWTREPGNANRVATLKIPTTGKTLDLSISKLGAKAGGLLPNVNRWRRQIILEPLTQEQLDEIATQVPTADGTTALVVDMLGPGIREAPMGAGSGAPMTAPGSEPSTSDAAEFTYDVPAGWEEVPPRSRITLKAFRYTEGSEAAELTVTTLSGEAGGLLSNVNRWRRQIGLPPLTQPNELIRASAEVTVGGQRGVLVDFTGTNAPGPPRVLGAIVLRPAATWFFKMTGPADLVGRQKSALDAFLKSVRFSGADKGHP